MPLWPSERTEVWRNRYKMVVDANEGRRKREDQMVDIRKRKREETLLKSEAKIFKINNSSLLLFTLLLSSRERQICS
ncbi:hypothetical protein LIER_17288 [Lithospermum erythrorhizon]|uniref:IBB domain-containing protein n=1 Tax=Lithospermum erythrorhizon TaxID=34254 RepID=A0AAV3QA01_LITER